MKDSYEEKYDDEPSFSLSDFKKWMATQKSEKRRSPLFGTQVESKLGLKRLAANMIPDEGDLLELAREFRKHGGKIIDTDEEHNLVIEVDSGSFKIPKFFVRKIRD